MCKDNTTAKYEINGQSFCYKYEIVQYMFNVMGLSVSSIAGHFNQSELSVIALIDYKKPAKTKEYKSKRQRVLEIYDAHPNWTYTRIANKAKCAHSYVSAVLHAKGVVHRKTKTTSKKKSFTANEWEQVMFNRMVLTNNVSEIRVTNDLLATIDVKVNPDTGVMTINKR